MSARLLFSLPIAVAWPALLGAAPETPAAALKNFPPALAAPADTKTPPPAPAPGETPAAKTDAPRAPDSAPAPVAPPAAEAAPKPGILTAVKAKGPPPVSKTPPPPVPLSPRFQQVRQKMAALFDMRNAPPTAPDPRSNPFRPPGAAPPAPLAPLPTPDGAALAPIAVNTDLALLQQAVATLRVKGTVQLGKTIQLVITSALGKEGTYKEGDVINVNLAPDPVHLRVRVITRNSVTLTLGEAEMALKF
jgi:hypothetical protein